MRCKLDELAIVKRGAHGLKHAGKVVEVAEGPWPGEHGPEWTVKFKRPITLLDGTVSRLASCPDAWLTPIRDPGPDAVDEMVQITRGKEPSPEFVGQTAFTDFGQANTLRFGFVGV